MAATVQSVSTANPGNASSVTVTKPTGLSVGDLMIAHYTYQDATDKMGTLTGWTHAVNNQSAGGTVYMGIQWKIADSADVAASDFTFGLDGLVASPVVAISRIDGYQSDDLLNFDVSSVQPNTGSPTFDCAVTPFSKNSLLLLFISSNDAGTPAVSGYAVANNNPTWTERYDIGPSSSHNCAMASATYSAATTTGNASANVSGPGTQDPVAVLVSIISAPYVETVASTDWTGVDNGDSLTVNKPSGVEVGDLMIAHIGVIHEDNGTIDVSEPAGWDIVGSQTYTDPNATVSIFVYSRVATSADVSASDYDFGNSSGDGRGMSGAIYRILNCSSAPLSFTSGTASGTASPSFSNTLTPAFNNGLLLFLYTAATSSGPRTVSGYTLATDNPAWTEKYEYGADGSLSGYFGSGNGASPVMAGASAFRPQSTATGNSSLTLSGTVNYMIGGLVSIPPLQAGVGIADVGIINVISNDVTTGPSGQMFSDHDAFLVQGENSVSIPDNFTDIEFNIKVTAVDATDRTILSYVGTPTITSTGTLVTGSGVTDPFVLGVLTPHAVEFSNSGAFTITATDGAITGTSNSFDIFDLTYMQNHKGDIFYPVKILPTLSNVKHINIIMAPVAGISGTKKEAAIKFYFNMSSTPAYTKYITRDDIAKGYVSYEINKPYVNSIQMEVEYYNSSNLNPDGLYSTSGEADFCPAYAEIIYERTDTIR